jgi:large subunit ribosomal protein L23
MFRSAPRFAPVAKAVSKQFKMWMPTMPMMMVSVRNATATRPAWAIFRVLPRMTKHEIKEYLTQIYKLPVTKVNTMNYDGKRKRIFGRNRIAYYKYADFKKAVVTFDKSIQDVGKGMRIPEMDDEDNSTGLNTEDAGESAEPLGLEQGTSPK